MSWPPDAPQPDADSPLESSPAETETPSAAADAASEPAKTPRRRTRKPPTPPVEAVADAAPEPAAQAAEPVPGAAPARRRGRNRTEETPIASTVTEEAAPPAPPARRRGRNRAEEAPVVSTVTEEAATPAPPTRRRGRKRTEETPIASTVSEDTTAPAESAAPTRRRGRNRTEEAPAVEAVSEEATPASESISPAAPAAATRRRGRKRPEKTPAVEAVSKETDTVANITPPPAEAEANPEATERPTTRSSRRGRRKTAVSEIDSIPPPPDLPSATEIHAAAESTDTEAAAGSGAAEESDSKRRRRRGRKRRGTDDAILESVELTESGSAILSGEDEDAEDEVPFFIPPTPAPVYVAPPLVPPVFAPSADALLPTNTAAIRHDTRLPRILVNETEHLPYLFFVNPEAAERGETVDSQIRLAAAAGTHLYSGVMYLPLKNAYGDRSFGPADALVQQILAADPDAFVIPRLQFVPTNFWIRTHPEEMAQYAEDNEPDVSLASTEFWADCVDALEALISHFADPNTPGGDRIIGFHLDRGEWFHDSERGPDLSSPNQSAFQQWLQAKYQATYALRAAWYDGSVTFDDAGIPQSQPRETRAAPKKSGVPLYAGARDGRWVDYALYSSAITAKIITGLAAAVKALSERRLLVAVSYGYTLEFCTRSDSGHLALGQVLASPDIDIIAGPNSYAARGAGGTGAFGSPLDSIALHGKLWMVEDDTKTFLAEAETPDTYNPKIALGADTQAAHQRNFGAALAHNAGLAWMDLWGQGWLDAPEIWDELGSLQNLAQLRDQIVPSATPPDVAVLVDEASLAYIKSDPNGIGLSLITKTRDLLLRTGASLGFYLQSDLTHENFPDAKLYLFLNALRVTTKERQAIQERLQRPGKTLAWLFAPALFDEKGATSQERTELVGIGLRPQSWNARLGSQITEVKHPITERLRGGRRVGQDEMLNPSYAVSDPQATILAEYTAHGAPSLAVREHASGWKSVFIGDPHLSVELLRGLCAYAGVPLYDAQDDIVYAADGTLLIHASFTGQRTINLPRKATVYDTVENTIIATDTRSFRVFLRARTSRLFLWGERDAVEAATGLTAPAAVPTKNVPVEAALLPPPPEILVPTALPLSEPAFQIAARDERLHADDTRERISTLEVSDLKAVLDMEDGEGDGVENAGESDNATGDEPARPRSRWQRRRAAARARREAERQTGGTATETDETSRVPAPPVDISLLLPDLPPRIKSLAAEMPPREETSQDQEHEQE